MSPGPLLRRRPSGAASRARASGLATLLLALGSLAACASVPVATSGPAAAGGGASGAAGATAAGGSPDTSARSDLVPAGYGTLHQDEFTVDLRSGSLLVKVTPLAERVIRLAAPDTYNRLHVLATRFRDRAVVAAAGDMPQLFLVSFFSYDPDIPYQPEDLLITHQGRLKHPVAIFALTPGWGRQRLAQQEVESAVYVFSGSFNYELPMTVQYELQRNDDWTRIIPVLDAERSKVRARAASGGPS